MPMRHLTPAGPLSLKNALDCFDDFGMWNNSSLKHIVSYKI